MTYRPRSWSSNLSTHRPLVWAALAVGMITVVVGVTEHDLRWGDGAGLATVAALLAARAVYERRSWPAVWPPIESVSRAAAMTVAGVLTPIWIVDFVVMGIVRADAGSYIPGGLMLVYGVGAVVAILWVASLLAVLWVWTATPPVSDHHPVGS